MTDLDVLDVAQPWLAVCGPCDAGLPQPCTHPSGDYRPILAALADEVRRAREEAARYADALDSVGCAVETATDDTLRGGIRSVVRRARPEAIALWSVEPTRFCHNCGHACAHNPPHPLVDTPNGPVCKDQEWCRQLQHADQTAKSCPCLPGAPPHVHGVGGYRTTEG